MQIIAFAGEPVWHVSVITLAVRSHLTQSPSLALAATLARETAATARLRADIMFILISITGWTQPPRQQSMTGFSGLMRSRNQASGGLASALLGLSRLERCCPVGQSGSRA